MELTCGLVLLIVSSVTASPYGYGTKGGAAAKADASAVAGAYTGVGDVPTSIPSGAGYSGSFSKSSSSSFSSSSASSSSSAFSYSGSGAIAIPGATNKVNGCDSAACHGGTGLTGAQGSGAQGSSAAGSQAYSGANAASLAGGKLPTSSYGQYGVSSGAAHINNAQDCGPEGCQGIKGSDSQLGSGTVTGSQSSSDAKAASSVGAGLSLGSLSHVKDSNSPNQSSECGGSECSNLSGNDNNCATGQCESNGDANAASLSHNGSYQKCASGQCGVPSIDLGSNDIHVPVSKSYNSKINYGSNDQSKNDNTLTIVPESGCSNGKCAPSADSKPYTQSPPELPKCDSPSCNYAQGPSSTPTAPGHNKPSTYLTAPKLEPACTTPNCQNTGYSHGNSLSHSAVKPSGSACTPGTPGCNTMSYINNPPQGYDGSPTIKPNYSHETSPLQSPVKPFGPACVPGTPGCGSVPSISGPLDCASGNCATNPVQSPGFAGPSSVKPSYSYGTPPSHFPVKSYEPTCAPGTPGCGSRPSISGPLDCASGNCATNLVPSPGFAGPSSVKPSYSHGTSPSHFPVKSYEPTCAPGTPGCGSGPSISGPLDCVSGNCATFPVASPGYSGSSSTKPGYTFETSSLHSPVKPSGPVCAPGTPGCGSVPSISGPIDCALGNCPTNPVASPGFGGPSSIKPSYFHETSPSHFSVKPSGPACLPGTPGCGSVPSISGPIDCASGNCATNLIASPGFARPSSIKPSYAHETSPSHSPVTPFGPACAPGTPGCGNVPSISGSIGCTSGNCAPGCAPGTPGCNIVASVSILSGCTTGNCATYPSAPGYGGSANIRPSYSPTSSSPLKPPGPACAPGTPGCGVVHSSISGSSNCASGSCGDIPSSHAYGGSLNVKPSYNYGIPPSGPACTPGTFGCNLAPSTLIHSGSSLGLNQPSYIAPSTALPSAPSTGASGAGSSATQAGLGSYGTGSIQTSHNLPSTGFPTVSSGSGSNTALGYLLISSAQGATLPNQGVVGIDSPAYTVPSSVGCKTPNCDAGIGNVGATAGSYAKGNEKAKVPAYTGGFGGPPGILKPNEFSVPLPAYQNKPAVSTGTSTTINKPACTIGNCDKSSQSPSYAHAGSASGAHAAAGASADVVVYNGGFGGPPGLLTPYDHGKGPTGNVIKDSFPGLHQGIGGNGVHSSYSSLGGSQLGGTAQASVVAQANAAAFGATGTVGNKNLQGDNSGSYGHGQNGANSCGGGCGGNRLGAANAVAKSVASATGGAGAYGSAGSYASSSATAHASSGASVKGGYGRR